MIELIDTHAHLYDHSFAPDIDDVVGRAIGSGVSKVVLPAIDSSHYGSMMACVEQFPSFVCPAIGLHPTSVGEDWKSELDFVFEKAEQQEFCAIGEIGLDGYWSKKFMREQLTIFREQIELAIRKELPVIVHVREATEGIFDILESCRHLPMRGVFHAYSGSLETFKRVRKYGDFMFGIGGVATYKNSHLPETVKAMGLERIVLETDSPWLTPVPHRGKRNEPAHVRLIALKISEITGIPFEKVAQITTSNANSLFKL